jgi:hypothetical protein
MARRRRSPLRTLLALTTLLGVGAAAAAGVAALREHVRGDGVVLSVDSVSDPDPPDPHQGDAASMDRVAPISLRFEEVGVDDQIRPVGIEEDGEMEVPDQDEIGWWQFGSAPGLPGATVLAAHVSWNDALGPFYRLGDAELGDRIEVTAGDGSVRVYQVVERTMYVKDGLPADRIWTTTGDESLVLITCGGDFNPSIRRYRHNIVVYAVPIDSVPVAPTPTVDGPTDELDA